MSLYGSIGYTRRDHYRERTLNNKNSKILQELESELRALQDKRDALYDICDISYEELKELEKPIQIKIDDLIDRVCSVKYEKVW
ncbi:hypothetical protein K413DRAFT_4708 [Clostridium sp. ASBs410]|nr:hypothetical protein K413DRAFT_4708 [Clostridium sp. ASBs410]